MSSELSTELNLLKVNGIIASHPSLFASKVDIGELKATVDFLRLMKFTDKEILSRPYSLLTNQITLANRLKVLEECSFRTVEFNVLTRFILVMNQSVRKLKNNNFIDSNVCVHKNLAKRLDVEVSLELGEDLSLKRTRQIVIEAYLKEKLEMTESEIEKVWKV